MKKIIAIIAMAAFIFACKHFQNQSAGTAGPLVICSDTTNKEDVCPIVPYDVNENFPLGYASFLDSLHQTPFDIFSWQTFIALNWPADKAGKPIGTSISGSPGAMRVWEHYDDPAKVFGTNMPMLNLTLGQSEKNGQKFLYLDSKSPQSLDHIASISTNDMRGFQEADGFPLIDRNLNFALYEIKMNPVETKFTIVNHLTTTQGIIDAGKASGNIDLPKSDTATKNLGMIEIKASWRILIPSAGDDTSRYYCRKATIFIDSLHTRSHKPLIIRNVTVGLVGMHIVRKTAKTAINQIWTTFEHIDNAPDDQQEAQMSGRQWSFYNPNCLNCTPNAHADTIVGDHKQYMWQTDMPYGRDYATGSPGQQGNKLFGTQVMRVYPVYRYTEMVNRQWQAKLKGTVWANYRLIGSQWEISEGKPNPIAPHFLGNTTLETFTQADASCINCHRSYAYVLYNAKKDTVRTDMSFIFPVYARVNNTLTPAKKK